MPKMDVTTGRWSNTKRVLLELQALLYCGVCRKTLKDPLCLGRCEHYFCWSCAETHLGKACPLCGVPSHVKDAQPNRQLGAATSLCGQLMVILGLNDQSVQDPLTDRVFDKALLDSEASNLTEKRKEKKATSIEEKRNDFLGVDIRPRAALVRKRSGNLKFTDAKLWNENAVDRKDNENEDACRATGKRELEENKFLSEDLSGIDRQGPLVKSESHFGKQIGGESCTRPGKRMRAQTRSDIRMENVIEERKKGLLLEGSIRKVIDGAVIVADADEMRGDEGQQEDESVRVRKRRRVLLGNATTATTPGHETQKCSIFKSKNSAINGDGNIPSETRSASEEKEECGSASMSRRRNVQMPNHSNIQKNKRRQSKDNNGLLQKPKAQNEFASPDVDLKSDNSSILSSSGHLLSSLFSTPKSQASSRKSLQSRKAARSPRTPQLRSHSSITPNSALVTPKTKRSPMTPNSSRGSARKRNEKGETRLHVECIKGDLDAVRFLLEEGENPNVRDFANWTPLHEACNHGYVKIAELLLNYGAMINVPGGENATPLHDAVQNYRLGCVRLLVSRGASKTLRDLHGKTAVDLALTSDMKEALNVPVTIIDCLVPSSQSIGTSLLSLSQSVTLLMTGLDVTSKSSLMECAKKLNWKVMNDFSSEGIRACDKTSSRVEEEPFEISGSTHSTRSFAPRKGRDCVAQQLPLLFNGCHFYFHGDFHHPSPSKDDLSKLVRLGSGLVLAREPKQETIDQSDFIVPYHSDPLSSLANCGYFVVSDNSDFVMIGSRMCRVSPAWILSSIAEFRLVEHNSLKS